MINLLKLSIILLFLSGLNLKCANTEIPDFEACPVELPVSKDGYCKRVVSQTSRRIPKEKWKIERRTMVCLPSDSYRMIKNQFYKQCFNSRCKQALNSIGDIFQGLDDTIKILDGLK
jgi:hypothetical protein